MYSYRPCATLFFVFFVGNTECLEFVGKSVAGEDGEFREDEGAGSTMGKTGALTSCSMQDSIGFWMCIFLIWYTLQFSMDVKRSVYSCDGFCFWCTSIACLLLCYVVIASSVTNTPSCLYAARQRCTIWWRTACGRWCVIVQRQEKCVGWRRRWLGTCFWGQWLPWVQSCRVIIIPGFGASVILIPYGQHLAVVPVVENSHSICFRRRRQWCGRQAWPDNSGSSQRV